MEMETYVDKNKFGLGLFDGKPARLSYEEEGSGGGKAGTV